MVKASMNGDGEVFDMNEILEGLKLNMTQFEKMCIAAGCDFLRNVKGVGIQRAFENGIIRRRYARGLVP